MPQLKQSGIWAPAIWMDGGAGATLTQIKSLAIEIGMTHRWELAGRIVDLAQARLDLLTKTCVEQAEPKKESIETG